MLWSTANAALRSSKTKTELERVAWWLLFSESGNTHVRRDMLTISRTSEAMQLTVLTKPVERMSRQQEEEFSYCIMSSRFLWWWDRILSWDLNWLFVGIGITHILNPVLTADCLSNFLNFDSREAGEFISGCCSETTDTGFVSQQQQTGHVRCCFGDVRK